MDEVRAFAKLLYAPEEIGIALGISSELIAGYMLDVDCDFYKCYWSAYFETDIKFRNSIIKLAIAGSSPAQVMVTKMNELREVKRFYE